MSTVWLMVDDADPRLSYSGHWEFISNSDSFGDLQTGCTFNNTLHSTSDNVSLSFRFNGSSYLGVYRSQFGQGTPPASQIQCVLDGAMILLDPTIIGLSHFAIMSQKCIGEFEQTPNDHAKRYKPSAPPSSQSEGSDNAKIPGILAEDVGRTVLTKL
ncbi:hypothetical protein GYMLUDRAFT_243015 [Collybiopsis luxurians FD-317 M1]|uniref:Uncharacterized protein n=1 Tax=Collybiopsis luxurians FD-317 M1 TaxID=944289 RepID=A0A0D0C0Y3_9AGAR|nr:hypothetical protein GYMLUDRAFT_243015 [Collybiopsis luxurians FD-317 M1]